MKLFKRVLCAASALALVLPTSGVCASSATQVTEYQYTTLVTGAKDGLFAYTAYNADGALVMGTMSASGEETRTAYSFSGWDALFEETEWKTTTVGDGTPLCPYSSSHGDNTVCPYKELEHVHIENTLTGVKLEDRYVPSGASQELPSGQVHFCFGRYGYKEASTLRWDGESRYFALKNEQGLWGVFDSASASMVVPYSYADMSAVYGEYAKVFNGTAWGRLDVSGGFRTQFVYDTQDAFSVCEEVRAIGDGQWQVFSKDNEPMSAVITGDYTSVTYAADAYAVTAKASDGTTLLIDLNGETMASFEETVRLRYLQGESYAAEKYNTNGSLIGMALWRTEDPVLPGDRLLRGDVNFDGVIDSRDARLAMAFLLEERPLTAMMTYAADTDADKAVNTADVREILCVSAQR